MATTNISVKFRPVRMGFLIRQGNVDDIVTAAGINSLLYGGIRNPIIPISTDNEFAETLMRFFNVDVIYPVASNKEIDSFIEKYPLLHNPYFVSSNLFYEDWQTKKNNIMYLDSFNIIAHYWEKEFKNKPSALENVDSKFTLIKWLPNDLLSNLFSVCFGFYPDTYNLNDDFENWFLKGLRAKLFRLAPDEVVRARAARMISPLLLTELELKGHQEKEYENGVYVGQENDFDDLLYFWNLRATGLSLAFLPINNIQRLEGFVITHLKQLDEVPNSPIESLNFLSVHCLGQNISIVQQIINRFQTNKKLVTSPCDSYGRWNGLNLKLCNSFFGEGNTLANLSKLNARYSLALQLPQIPIINIERNSIERQSLITSIDSMGERYNYPLHTLKPPFIRELNGFYGGQIVEDSFKVRVEKRGIRVITEPRTNSLFLSPIPYEPLIKEVFNHAGIGVEISQAGIILKQIIQKLGDLEGGRVFKISGVRRLLATLRKDDSTTSSQAKQTIFRKMVFNEVELKKLLGNDFEDLVNEHFICKEEYGKYVLKNQNKVSKIKDERVKKLHEGDFKKFEKLHIEKRKELNLTIDRVWDFLLMKEFFRAGLDLECQFCKLINWLPLREVDDWWFCIYCGGKNQTSLFLRSGSDWKFRKSGLFAKDNNQEGAIPVLLTLLQFHRRLNYFGYNYTPSLKLKLDSKECETDFCVMQYRIGHSIEMGIGECKSEGGIITIGDINNLKLVRERVNQSGMNCFLIFSKVSDYFEDEELNLFRDLAEEDIPFILWSNKELEPYDVYEEYKELDSIDKHPSTLQAMAWNSRQIYIGDD